MKIRLRRTLTLAALASLMVMAASAPALDSSPNTLVANLSGANEVPDAGDPNGEGRALINIGVQRRRVCFKISFGDIVNPLSGHIHRGGRGVAGDIVVPLFNQANGVNSPVQGCRNEVPRERLRKIRANPGRFYVNLHNKRYPGGALRGQLRQR